MKGILGRKLGMTQVFDDDGNVTAVSVVQAGPCTVLRKKSEAGKDGYAAVVLGFEDIRSAEVDGETVYKANKPTLGFYEKNELTPKKIVREVRVHESQLGDFEVGQELNADAFLPGEKVDVVGTSKGRGFAGVMKRHNMHGYHATHGTHEYRRHGGSIGASATPAKVWKGVKMAGQYGNARVTMQNLKVVEVDTENNLILIKGGIPGATGSVVLIQDAVKMRRN